MAELAHIFRALVHRFPMEELDAAELVVERGVEGCIHGRPSSKRQILVMDEETLKKLGVPPGAVKENITTRGLDLGLLAAGDRLQVAEAILEVTGPCHPCERMNEIRAGLEDELFGQRGLVCRVVHGGTIQRGDAIKVMTPKKTTKAPVQEAQ